MGHAYAYRCSHCGYEESFNEGHGFLIHSQPVKEYLGRRVKLFHYKTHELLKNLARKDDSLFLKAGFRVYKCPKCKILYDKTDVIVYSGEKVIHKSDFRCAPCRSRLKLTNIHRLKNAICPQCLRKTFQLDQTQRLLWR